MTNSKIKHLPFNEVFNMPGFQGTKDEKLKKKSIKDGTIKKKEKNSTKKTNYKDGSNKLFRSWKVTSCEKGKKSCGSMKKKSLLTQFNETWIKMRSELSQVWRTNRLGIN